MLNLFPRHILNVCLFSIASVTPLNQNISVMLLLLSSDHQHYYNILSIIHTIDSVVFLESKEIKWLTCQRTVNKYFYTSNQIKLLSPWGLTWSNCSSSFTLSPPLMNGKESACNVGDLGSIPGLGRSPEEGNGNPLPVFLPGEFHGERSLACSSPWGHNWVTNTTIHNFLTILSSFIFLNTERLLHLGPLVFSLDWATPSLVFLMTKLRWHLLW